MIVVELQEEHLNCFICSQPFSWDMDSSAYKNNLPVLSSSKTCDHYFCLGCILNQQASVAEDMPNPPKWIKCMTCKASTSFCPEKPKFHRLLIDLLHRANYSQSSSSDHAHANDAPRNDLKTVKEAQPLDSNTKVYHPQHARDQIEITSISKPSLAANKENKIPSTHLFHHHVPRKRTSSSIKDEELDNSLKTPQERSNVKKKSRSQDTVHKNEQLSSPPPAPAPTVRLPTNSKAKIRLLPPAPAAATAAARGTVPKTSSDTNKNTAIMTSLPESIDDIIRYMDRTIPPTPGYHSYFVSQQDNRFGCSHTRGKLRAFAKKNPDHPATAHYMQHKKWKPPNEETLDLMVQLLKQFIKLKKK